MGSESSFPLVSVVVPVHDRLRLLRDTVETLSSQSLKSARYLLVDDRSDAATRKFLADLAAKDPRFEIITKPDSIPPGAQTSRNLGLDRCATPYLMFLDSDDLLAPRCLEDRLAFLERHPEADLAVGNQAILNEASGETNWVNIPNPEMEDLDRFLALAGPTDVPWVNGGCLFRTEALHRAGVRWRPEFSWDDVAFHFEALVSGLRPAWMPRTQEPDSFYRLHGGDHFGQEIHGTPGRETTCDMLLWMFRSIREQGNPTCPRRARLSRSLFHAVTLPSLDSGQGALALDSVAKASTAGLCDRAETRSLQRYCRGRSLLRWSPRLTYHWNQFARRGFLSNFFADSRSSYGVHPVAGIDASALPTRLS